MKKMKKTTMVFLALIMLMIANFTVAAAYSYNFTIIRANEVYTSSVTKNKTANYGIVSVLSASASGYYTRYCICSEYSSLEVSDPIELQNVRGRSGHMDYANPFLTGGVRMKGIDARMTAPNYSTVTGYWSPTQTLG